MTDNSVYICLNLKDFPGISNNSSRSDFKENLQNEIALVVSENLLSKSIQAINLYGPVSRYFSTNFDDILAYYSLETKNNIQLKIDNGYLYIRYPITGSAGLNIIGLHPSLNAPTAIMMKAHVYREGLNPFNKIDKGDIVLSVDSVRLEGGNLATRLSNFLLAFAQIIFLWPEFYEKKQLSLLSLASVTPKLNDYYQLEFSEQTSQTSNDEIVLKSKIAINLIDGVTLPEEKIFNQQLVIVPLDINYGQNGTIADSLIAATSIASDANNNLYVNDVVVGKIVKYDSNGNEVASWGGWGITDGLFAFPFYIAYDITNNRLLITDTINRRVQIFNTDGNYINQWGGWNDLNYNFSVPQFMAINPINGEIFVVDAAKNYRVQHFDSDLNFIREWGGNGNEEGMFVGITSIAINSSGEVFISDFSFKKIKNTLMKASI